MAQSSDRKILRIGVIQNGKIIEERLLRKRESVTVGQSPRNTFVLPSASLPRSYTLFDLKSGSYQLNFKDGMDGRVSVDDAVLDFQALKGKLANKKGDKYSLPLSEKTRGKVVIGDVTLLFQFVTPPPPPSKLQLPASVRGGWLKNIDWTFMSFILGSFVVQTFSVAFVVTRDYPEPKGIEAMKDNRFIEMVVTKKPEPPPPEEKKTEEKKDEDGEKKEEKKAEKKKKKPKPKPKPKEVKAPPKDQPEEKPRQMSDAEKKAAEAERKRMMQEQINQKTVLGLLGTKGEGEGSVVNSLVNGAANVKMEDAFAGTTGVAIADNSIARDRRRVKGGAGKVAKVDASDLKAKGGGAVGTGTKGKEMKVSGRVRMKKKPDSMIGGVLDASKVAKVVSRRRGSIKQCYEKELKRDPGIKGKVKLQFTILTSGRVGSAKVIANSTKSNSLAKCIENQAKRWRFPKPSGGNVTVAFPFLFEPSS